MAIDKVLKPRKKYKLVRLGSLHDGGYLVGENSLKNAETLISFGIEDNWQFEKDFQVININSKIKCFDDKSIFKYLVKKFIVELFLLVYYRRLNFIKYFKNIIDFLKIRKKIDFIQKKISYNDLKEIFTDIKNNNIFLKIDIEGSEYRILEEIIENQNRIIGLVIEFHDFDYHKSIIYDFCKKLNLILIHIHPNNFSQKDKNGDPLVIELTFERDPTIVEGDLILPHELDMKNNSLENDIELIFK